MIAVFNTSNGHIVKVAVTGDLFSRSVWPVPVKDESAALMARVILDECILRFGPPGKDPQ